MKLSVKSIIGYGAGDAANNLAFTLGTTFLLRYSEMIAETDSRKKAILDTPPVAPVPVPAIVLPTA